MPFSEVDKLTEMNPRFSSIKFTIVKTVMHTTLSKIVDNVISGVGGVGSTAFLNNVISGVFDNGIIIEGPRGTGKSLALLYLMQILRGKEIAHQYVYCNAEGIEFLDRLKIKREGEFTFVQLSYVLQITFTLS